MAAKLLRLGAGATDTPDDVVCLGASVSAANYDTFDIPVGTAYPVPAGKTLVITKVDFNSEAANAGWYIGYADNVINDAAGPPTTPVRLTPTIYVASANTQYKLDLAAKVPAGKYAFIKANGAFVLHCMAHGYIY